MGKINFTSSRKTPSRTNCFPRQSAGIPRHASPSVLPPNTPADSSRARRQSKGRCGSAATGTARCGAAAPTADSRRPPSRWAGAARQCVRCDRRPVLARAAGAAGQERRGVRRGLGRCGVCRGGTCGGTPDERGEFGVAGALVVRVSRARVLGRGRLRVIEGRQLADPASGVRRRRRIPGCRGGSGGSDPGPGIHRRPPGRHLAGRPWCGLAGRLAPRPILERGAGRETGRQAEGLLVGDGPGRRTDLRVAAVAMVRDVGAGIAIVFEGDEWTGERTGWGWLRHPGMIPPQTPTASPV